MFKTKRQKAMSAIVCGLYIFLLIWLILFKFNINFADLDHMRNINLIPFQESLIVNGRIDLKEIIYNILVFVPLGVYVSMFKSNWPFGKKNNTCFMPGYYFGNDAIYSGNRSK